MPLAVTAQDGTRYQLEYRDLDGSGRRLAARRRGGPDDPPGGRGRMMPDRWYRVSTVAPLPPEIGTRIRLILDPDEDDVVPVVRTSALVVSVVGLLD